MLVTVLLAVAVPLGFLYALHWLDLYGTDRPRTVLLCVGWGAAAFVISFAVNHLFLDVAGVTRVVLSTRIAPFVEELAKAGVLVWLARRSTLDNTVDGAIYGFAAGVGFAALENLRYIQLFPDNALALTILRDFSSALSHATSAALIGIAVGALASSSRRVRRAAFAAGLGGAMALHYAWNNLAFHTPFSRAVTEWIMVGEALAGVVLVAVTIVWTLRHERAQLQATLGAVVGVSEQETSILQHLDDLDRLLQPITKRFGRPTATRVARLLQLEARLELTERCRERAADPAFGEALAKHIAELERAQDAERRALGLYVMLHVRSIVPAAHWSLWARLGQACAAAAPSSDNVWQLVRGRRAPSERDMYARLREAMAAQRTAAHATRIDDLPEPLRACIHHVHAELAVTARHAAERLGRHEREAHAMLSELVERGLLHRTVEAGSERFRALVAPRHVHIWRAVRQRA